ncbi:MAG: MATE family efflux transporter [Clostridiales bacterium]|nr:MATE family efflux transporter [Clostridiales bacterium]
MKVNIRAFFADRAFLKKMFAIATPIIIQKLLISTLNMTDVLMVGRLGDTAVAAVGVSNQLFFIFMLFMEGVAASCSIFAAQYWGAKDRKGILNMIGMGLVAALLIGAVFSLVALCCPGGFMALYSNDPAVHALSRQYLSIVGWCYTMAGVTLVLAGTLRATGNTRIPMLISIITVLIHTTLNLVLIFGLFGFPRMGVAGAALGTTISRAVELLLMTRYVFGRGSVLRGRLRDYLDIDLAQVRHVVRRSLPVVLNDMLWGLGYSLYTVAYGRLGTAALAAQQIVGSVRTLFMVLSFAVADAALVMIGNLVGAGEHAHAMETGKRVLVLSVGTGLLAGTLLGLLAPGILTLYDVSASVRRAAVNLLRISAAAMPLMVLSGALIVGIFRGGGDSAFAMRAELSAMWLAGLPLTFALVLFYPGVKIEMLLCGLLVEDLLKAILGLRHFRAMDWIRPVVQVEAA